MVQTNIKDIIILGSSGGCLDIYDLIKDINIVKKKYNFVGFLENNKKKIPQKYKKFYLGPFRNAKKFKNAYFATAIGNENNFHNKENILANLQIENKKFHSLIHPTAIIGENVKIGNGTIIHNGTYIGRNCKLGNFLVILPKNIISHDSKIGSFTIVNSSCILAGNVNIKKNCYLGSGVNIRDHVTVKSGILVGMGSLVTKNLSKQKSIYYGIPAKFMRRIAND